MNILVVSQYFYPEEFKINDLVSEFINRGHSVTVLTGKPIHKVFGEDLTTHKRFFVKFGGHLQFGESR